VTEFREGGKRFFFLPQTKENDEIRMTNDETSSNAQMTLAVRFVIPSSFVIRASSFFDQCS
jgi:hypothetical protein